MKRNAILLDLKPSSSYNDGMIDTKLAPIHPGEVLREEFLKPLGLSQNRLALEIGVPARRINEIVLGKRGVTATRRSPGALLWYVTAILARPSNVIRS